MTHVDAAIVQRMTKRAVIILTIGLSAQWLVGCGSTSSLSFPGFADNKAADQTQTASAAKQATPIKIAQIIGAPPTVAKKISGALASAAAQTQTISISSGANQKADYTVRGYLVAAPHKSGTKLSYIWDLTDSAGKRAHRIKGEELVVGAKTQKGADPWSRIDSKAVEKIAKKTAMQLAKWVPKRSNTAVAKIVPAAKSTRANPRQTAAMPRKRSSAKNRTQIASVPGQVIAIVPIVAGAPGDGRQSLTTAIKKELHKSGIKLTNQPSQASYTVEGAVKMGNPKAGKQDIAIEWRVIDPKGKKLGTVSQRNTIPKGSLNGAWGKTADAAASAAAEGILKLLPKPKSRGI